MFLVTDESLTCMPGVPQHVAPGSSPVPVRPTLLTTPAGQIHLQSLTSAGGGAPEAGGQASRDPKAAFGEFNFVNQTRSPEKEVPKAVSRDSVDSSNKVCLAHLLLQNRTSLGIEWLNVLEE